MKYSEAAQKFNLQPLEEFSPTGEDFNVKVEDNKILIDENYCRGDLLCEI